MIKFACCSFNFIGLDLEQSLRTIRGMGIHHADIGVMGADAHVNQLQAAAQPEAVGTKLNEMAQQIEINLNEFFVVEVFVDGQPIRPNHPNAPLRQLALDAFARLCRCAKVAGCTSVMGVPGSPEEGLEDDRGWALAVDMLSQMVRIARDEGLVFHIEPHSGSIAQTPDSALRLAQEVEGLRFTLDYAHFLSLDIPQEAVQPLQAYAGVLHGKPCTQGVGKTLVHEMGIDFKTIVAELLERQWEGVISMECIWPVDTPVLTRHPTIQNALMAHVFERAIADLQGRSLLD
jgi:sugar phosphate isomerase/epimerase